MSTNRYTFTDGSQELSTAESIFNRMLEISRNDPGARFSAPSTTIENTTKTSFVRTRDGQYNASSLILRFFPQMARKEGVKILTDTPTTGSLTYENLEEAYTEFVNHMKVYATPGSEWIQKFTAAFKTQKSSNEFDTTSFNNDAAAFAKTTLSKLDITQKDNYLRQLVAERKVGAGSYYLLQNVAGNFSLHSFGTKDVAPSSRTSKVTLNMEKDPSDCYEVVVRSLTKTGKPSLSGDKYYTKDRNSRVLYLSSETANERKKDRDAADKKKEAFAKAASSVGGPIIVSESHVGAKRSEASLKEAREKREEIRKDLLSKVISLVGDKTQANVYFVNTKAKSAEGATYAELLNVYKGLGGKTENAEVA